MPNDQKQQVLNYIFQTIQAGVITPHDLEQFKVSQGARYAAAHNVSQPAGMSAITLSEGLQYTGGLVILTGIGVFVASFWSDLSSGLRVAIALGGAILAFIMGVVLTQYDTKSKSGTAFHIIAGCLLPFGFFVTANELFSINASSGLILFISTVLLMIYGAAYALRPNIIFTVFALAAGISAIFAAIATWLPGLPSDSYMYIVMGIGLAGLGVGNTFRGTLNEPLADFMYSLGTLAVLSAAYWLFTSEPIWQLLYIPLLGISMMGAVHLKSSRMFSITILSTMGYVVYITGKYFADVVGWPVALIFSGIALIAIGYVAVNYRKQLS